MPETHFPRDAFPPVTLSRAGPFKSVISGFHCIFWVALWVNNSIMGLITKLSSPVKKLTALKVDGVAKSGNTGQAK